MEVLWDMFWNYDLIIYMYGGVINYNNIRWIQGGHLGKRKNVIVFVLTSYFS